ncbi:MAG: Maf family protein, partial [Clostridia bacterium]|nr:Maf family protein [Clostridia bacterium]
GLCVTDTRFGRRDVRVVTSEVVFRALDEAEIAAYVATGEPLDKAGAYAIQGGAAAFVDHFTGSYDNIVGLPTEELRSILMQWSVI